MADRTPSKSPPIQDNTDVQDDTDADLLREKDLIRQRLANEEAGKFDFDRDFGFIEGEDDFKKKLQACEGLDDKPKAPTDFPTELEAQQAIVKRIGKAFVSEDRATDAKVKAKAARTKRKPQATDADVINDDAAEGSHSGSQNLKDSFALSMLKRMKPTEIEIKSWQLLTITRDAQERQLSQGQWGARKKLQIAPYASFSARMNVVIDVLETTKNAAKSVFQDGEVYAKRLAAQPLEERSRHVTNKGINDKRAEKLVEKRKQDQSHSHNGPQPVQATPAGSHDQDIPKTIVPAHEQDERRGEGDVISNSPGKQPALLARLRRAQPSASNRAEDALAISGEKNTGMRLIGELQKAESLSSNANDFLSGKRPVSDKRRPFTASAPKSGPSTHKDEVIIHADTSHTASSGQTRHNAKDIPLGLENKKPESLSQRVLAHFEHKRQHGVPSSAGRPIKEDSIQTSRTSLKGALHRDYLHSRSKTIPLKETTSIAPRKRPYSIHTAEASSQDDQPFSRSSLAAMGIGSSLAIRPVSSGRSRKCLKKNSRAVTDLHSPSAKQPAPFSQPQRRFGRSTDDVVGFRGHKRQKLGQREGDTPLNAIEIDDDEEGYHEDYEEQYEDDHDDEYEEYDEAEK